jgi:Domain of unknown function (DUF4351)
VEPLAWALAALMRRGEWTRADHRLECLQRIATADLAPGRRWLLALWVKTYLRLKGRDLEEWSKLALPAYREVRDMELTWERTLEERENEGRREGRLEGGIEALRRFVLRQMERRFGALPESVRRKVEALDSTDSLTEVGDKLLDAGSIAEIGLGE